MDVLLGYWDWLDDRRVFYFEAAMEDEFGAHLLAFHHAVATGPDRVDFFDAGGILIAGLFPISDTGHDVAAYEKTWRRWLNWREAMLPFIRAVKQQLAG